MLRGEGAKKLSLLQVQIRIRELPKTNPLRSLLSRLHPLQSLQPPSLQAGGRRCRLTLAAAFGHIEIESDNDSISFFVRGDSLFPSCRKSSRTATRFTMFVRFLEIQKRSHFRTIALLFKFSFSKIIFNAIFPQSHPTTGRKPSPRRLSDRKIGNKAISPAPRKKSSRFPTQFRRDQTR